jgi:hypothetical protein
MARTAQISKDKRQSIIISRHEGQSIWEISVIFCFLKCSHKNIKLYDETGSHEDCYRKEDP